MNESNTKSMKIEKLMYKNRYIISVVVLIGVLMSILDGYMVTIALPTITKHFNVNITQSAWIITGYLVVMTGLFIVFGKISEYTGKVKLFMIGWALFTLSSLICGFATNINELIVFRITQAIGASMIAGVSGAILYHTFPMNEIGKIMGYFGATIAIGSLIGPGLGGFITNSVGWQYIFFINVPIGVILLILALKYLKIPETTSPFLNMDWIGSITLVSSVAMLILFLGELANGLKVTSSLIIYGIIFVFTLLIFLLQESRHSNPLIDMSIFRNRKFSFPVFSVLLFSISLNMAIVLVPFYFQGVFGYNPSQVGLFFMLVPLTMMFASLLGGKLYDKYHSNYAAGVGVLISSISFLLLGYAYLIMNIGLIIVSLLMWGIGYGLFTSPNSTETLSALPREKTAIASSVSTTAKSLGGAIGVSLASIILTIYLSTGGYNGVVLSAGASLLSNSIGNIMFLAGALCIISTLVALARNISNGHLSIGKGSEELHEPHIEEFKPDK